MATINRMEKLRSTLEGSDADYALPESEEGRSLGDRNRLEAMQSKGHIKLGSGSIDPKFWTMPRPYDKDDSTRAALLEDREQSF